MLKVPPCIRWPSYVSVHHYSAEARKFKLKPSTRSNLQMKTQIQGPTPDNIRRRSYGAGSRINSQGRTLYLLRPCPQNKNPPKRIFVLWEERNLCLLLLCSLLLLFCHSGRS